MRPTNLTGLKRILLNLILIAVLGLAAYLVYHHFFTNNANNANTITDKQLQDIQTSAGDKLLAQKKYQQAIDSYISSATSAESNNDFKSAEKILKEATQKIPDSNVPWYLYDNLASAAKQVGDSATEKDSLQKALTKAQASNSGAPTDVVNIYKARLKQLGVNE